MYIGVIIAFDASLELLVPQGFGIDLEAWRVWTAKLQQLRTSRCTSIFHHMGARKPANIGRGIGRQRSRLKEFSRAEEGRQNRP